MIIKNAVIVPSTNSLASLCTFPKIFVAAQMYFPESLNTAFLTSNLFCWPLVTSSSPLSFLQDTLGFGLPLAEQ